MLDELIIEIDETLWERPEGGYKILEFIIKRGGIWIFHKFDKDPFPSKPHGHNKETGEKLDVYTGLKYGPHDRKCTGKLHPAALLDVQKRLREKGWIK